MEHPATHRGKNSSSSAARTHVSTYKPRFHKNPENPIHNQSRNFQNHDQRERENKKAANIEREHQQGNQIHPRIWNIKITNIIISKTLPLKFSLHIRHSPLSSSRERERERESFRVSIVLLLLRYAASISEFARISPIPNPNSSRLCFSAWFILLLLTAENQRKRVGVDENLSAGNLNFWLRYYFSHRSRFLLLLLFICFWLRFTVVAVIDFLELWARVCLAAEKKRLDTPCWDRSS